MTVWAVLEHWEYEGSQVIRVFATEALANAYVASLYEGDVYHRVSYGTQEWAVLEALPE